MSWNLVKGELRHLDRAGLVGLLKELHALAPENRAFLAARFGLGRVAEVQPPLCAITQKMHDHGYDLMRQRPDTVLRRGRGQSADV